MNQYLHSRHMEFVDKVNNARTSLEHLAACCELYGFREGLKAAGIMPDLSACDETQVERGNGNRQMWGGMFVDWKDPSQESERLIEAIGSSARSTDAARIASLARIGVLESHNAALMKLG